MDSRFVFVEPDFFDEAKSLRSEFESRFENPRSTAESRFVWDYWYIEDQYNLLRTPGWEYFSEEIYKAVHEKIVLWGRRNLGCWDISPPWLSLYVNDCEQNLHSDVPHGPWAFVYSLSPEDLPFKGGNTLILKPETLSYWSSFGAAQNREMPGLVDQIRPEFNQLTVFDPRFPHGVSRLRGSRNPLEGRLVLHGWFTEPKPFVDGPLDATEVEEKTAEVFESIVEDISDLATFSGLLSLRLEIDAGGVVTNVRVLANTLTATDEVGDFHEPCAQLVVDCLKTLQFSSQSEGSELTLPVLFS